MLLLVPSAQYVLQLELFVSRVSRAGGASAMDSSVPVEVATAQTIIDIAKRCTGIMKCFAAVLISWQLHSRRRASVCRAASQRSHQAVQPKVSFSSHLVSDML